MTRRLTVPRAVLVSIALTGLGACGVGGSSPQHPGATPSHTRTTTTKPPAAGNGPDVVVSSRGTGPRKKLRLKLRAGDRTNLEIKVRTALTQTVAGQTQTVRVPPIIEDVDLRIMDVNGAVASFEYKVTGARLESDGTLPAAQAQAISSGLRRVVGLSASGRINDRGATLSSEVHVPSALPSSVRQTVQQLSDQLGTLSVPLPEEAVGEGATWTARSNLRLSSAKVAIRNTYRLTSVGGGVFTLAASQRQTAGPQAFESPNLPPGASARLVKWDITSAGSVALKLGNMLPEAKLHTSGRQSFALSEGKAKPETVLQDLSVDTDVRDIGN